MAASIGLLSCAAALRAWLQWVGPLPGDRYASDHFPARWRDAYLLRRLTSFFSSLGDPLIATLIVCIGLLVLWLLADRRTVYALVVACFVIPLNAVLKVASGPTPLWSQTHHAGNNFPSGHVAFLTSFAGYLGWVAARRRQPAGVLAALLVVMGVGPARVLTGAHLVSDVVAGYLVGGAVLVLAVAVAGSVPASASQTL